MTKTAKWSMIGVLAALVLALFAVAGCSSDNNAATDNSASNDAAGQNESQDNNGGGDNANSDNNANDDANETGDGTVLKVSNGWVAYSQGDMLALLDSDANVEYQWTAEVDGNTVLKDTDADIPSSDYNDQNANDVVGSAGMHVFGFLADDQNNGESTITMKLANTSDANDVKTTIVVKATVENGAFTNVSVQE
ncbi:protease inhibitor I42 family protein [Eggerthella timonensis]|uniref:protease inhibitor I42 family protein n=1 Tax=Eggerthella timonensis TaxID=1871008 RepID=UPI000C7773D2|nr:protease inhibitor I42 family protein [Eggerthella timonensis]